MPCGQIGNHNDSLFLELLDDFAYPGAGRAPTAAAKRPYLLLRPRLLEQVPENVGYARPVLEILFAQNGGDQDALLVAPIHDARNNERGHGKGASAVMGPLVKAPHQSQSVTRRRYDMGALQAIEQPGGARCRFPGARGGLHPAQFVFLFGIHDQALDMAQIGFTARQMPAAMQVMKAELHRRQLFALGANKDKSGI